VIRRLNGEVEKALKAPEVIERMEKLGLVIRHGAPEEMDRLIQAETERWQRIIKERNLKAD
jgi:tripartite-type tricarboxylate transporter receptor subunit TctC